MKSIMKSPRFSGAGAGGGRIRWKYFCGKPSEAVSQYSSATVWEKCQLQQLCILEAEIFLMETSFILRPPDASTQGQDNLDWMIREQKSRKA